MDTKFLIGFAGCLAVVGSAWLYGARTETDVVPVVRAGAIELVDEQGQVRAQLNVSGEDVVLRLRDADGVIRVKLAASKDGSGLLLLDESTEPGVHMLAQQESTIAVRDDGEVRQIRPQSH